jgi:aspartyl-tRNA(Asn)/glutamyl-tRNA(Gln) amidotransferase subunit C
MALTTEEVRKIASLARLRFSSEEEGAFAGQLGKIVDYIDQLQRFEAVSPAGGAAAAPARAPAAPPRAAPEDDDLPRPCLPRETFLANAPAAMDGFLLVPEVRRTSTVDARQGPDAETGVGDDLPS